MFKGNDFGFERQKYHDTLFYGSKSQIGKEPWAVFTKNIWAQKLV